MRPKTNIFPTNLQPECSAEAPTFLSAVYKRGTQAKKRQAYAPQYGRSMIEMLGVLAIIGVLTVGSITGYSRAMRRHLLNKQREQYSYILSAVETHHDMVNINTPDLPYGFTSILKDLGWIPEEMIKENYGQIYDVFGNNAFFYNWVDNYMGLQIYLKTPSAYEQCTNLYQTIRQYHSFLWITEVAKKNDGHSVLSNLYHGDKYCTDSRKCIRDLTPAQISQLCQICNDTEEFCVLYMLWK
ncbi:MAG: hypothetical protein IJ852_03990 [Alphaproteobacteria bacterium]|nr:hypothetical protein [Alphaproteobacteria bacterium]